MSDEKTLREIATDLELVADRIRGRFGEDGNQVLGWRGFNIDLDEAEELIELLRMRALGHR